MAEVGVPDHSWRTQAFRQRVRGQIEEAMRQAGNPTNKTSMEMENHVFQKAKTRDEYLGLVARLILHVRDINSKKDKQGGRMGPMGPGGMQDPINALQNLTKTGMGPGGPQSMMQMPQGMQTQMQPGMQHGMQQGIPQGMQPGMQQGMQPVMQQGMQQGMPQGLPPGMQQGIPPGMQQGMPQGIHQGIPQPGMPQQGIPQQGIPQQGIPQQSMPQGMSQVIPQSIASTMVQAMPQQMQPGMQMTQQMQPGMQQMQPGMPQRQPFQTYQQQVQAQQVQAQMAAGLRPNISQANMQAPRADFMMAGGQQQVMPPVSSGAMTQVSQSQQPSQSTPQQAQNQQNGPGSVPCSVPSPAQPQSNSGPIPSPANMLPSPSPGQVAPSPASRASMGVASPGSALNTPGNPNSVAPSPGSRNDTDEQTYLEKWKQLQKYIEPLKRMINRIDKDEDRRTDLSKMENLLFILSDSSKRLPYGTLLKCEQVLVKQDFQTKLTPTPPVTTTKTEQHMCQPLLDAVAQHIQSPTLNHTLKRTFGTAVQALHGTTNRPASPPTKKLKSEDDQNGEVSNVLQGEIARLDHRFKVNLDPLHHNGSKTVHLICKLDDKNLPSVPPITVTVPENYPDSSPTCDTSAEDYGLTVHDTTPFLRTVQKTLSDQLLKLPEKYSVTALLDTWEMSVRQACAPVSSTTK